MDKGVLQGGSGCRRTGGSITLLLATLSLAMSAPLWAWSKDSLGPLHIRSQSPAQVFRYVPVPMTPVCLKHGERLFGATATVTSIWAEEEGLYLIDMHMADYRISLQQGLGCSAGFELALSERRMVNAHLDQLTLNVHKLLDIGQNGRDEVEKNTTTISFPTYGYYSEGDGLEPFSRFVEATLKKSFRSPSLPRSAFSLSVTAKYELLDDGPMDEGVIDVGIAVGMMNRIGKNYLYANAGYTRFGQDHFYSVPMEKEQFTGMLAFEWRRKPDQSFIAQYLYTEGAVIGLGALSRGSNEVQLGYKWAFEQSLLEVAVIENAIDMDNSPDFGLSIGMQYLF